MFERIRSLLSSGTEVATQRDPDAPVLAAAAMLVAVARADHLLAEVEEANILVALVEGFGISTARANTLLTEVEEGPLPDLTKLTHDVRQQCSHAERRVLAEGMWRVAFADARLERMEAVLAESMVRLLGLTEAELADAKDAAAA